MYPSSKDFDYSAFAAGQQFGTLLKTMQLNNPSVQPDGMKTMQLNNPGLQPDGSVQDSIAAGQQMGANLQGGMQRAGNAYQAWQASRAAGAATPVLNAAGNEFLPAAAGAAGGAGAAGALASKL